MSKVFSALAGSVDGYITGRDPGPGRGLGDGATLFDWYFDGDVASKVFDGFKLSEPSARVFDALARRDGAIIAGRNTYEDSDRFGDDGSPHPNAPLFVLSHRPAPLVGGFLLTMVVNAPMSYQLAAVNPEAPAQVLAEARNAYEDPWNFWHGVRTVFSTLAFLALICACLLRDDRA